MIEKKVEKITGSARQMIIDYLHDNDAAGWKSDSLLDYEDPDYQNMGDDEIEEAENFIEDELEEFKDELETDLKSKWELTDAEIDDMIEEAFAEYSSEEQNEDQLEHLEDEFDVSGEDIDVLHEGLLKFRHKYEWEWKDLLTQAAQDRKDQGMGQLTCTEILISSFDYDVPKSFIKSIVKQVYNQ